MYRTYKGCVHIHSTYSDGSGTPEEIAAAARKAGLDFIILADHNNLGALADGKEGWHDSVLMLVGIEMSLKVGHYLAFDVPYDVKWSKNNVQETIDSVNDSGGFGFLSHPVSRWPWRDWSVDGYSGMELTNLNSLVRQEGNVRPGALLLDFLKDYFLSSRSAMRRVMSVASDGSKDKWAEMLRDKRLVGIGGADAHASINLGIGRLRIPSYLNIFKSIQVHILVTEPFNGNLAHDKALVYQAIREGRCYTAFTVWDNDINFEFTAETSPRPCSEVEGLPGTEPKGEASPDSIACAMRKGLGVRVSGSSAYSDRLVTMGDIITQDGSPVILKVDLDCTSKVMLNVYRDRELLLSTHNHNVVVPAPCPGAYRLEIDICEQGKQVPWIITNPIYVE